MLGERTEERPAEKHALIEMSDQLEDFGWSTLQLTRFMLAVVGKPMMMPAQNPKSALGASKLLPRQPNLGQCS